MSSFMDIVEERGFQRGFRKGEERLANLLRKLYAQKRQEDVIRALSDDEYRKQLYAEFEAEQN